MLDDIVIVSPKIAIPTPTGDGMVLEMKEFQLALVDTESGEVRCALALTPTADGTYTTARTLKGLHTPGVSVQILEVGSEAPLFASPPLGELRAKAAEAKAEADAAKAEGAATADELAASAAELAGGAFLGMGGMLAAELALPPYLPPGSEPPPEPAKGKGKAEEAAPTGASLACDSWRLQRALPTIGKPLPGAAIPISQRVIASDAQYAGGERYRTRPLACRSTAPKDLVAFESRLNGWRLELSDNHKIAPESWPPLNAAAALEANPLPSAAPRSTLRGGLASWPPGEWGEKWRAPYIPHHMHGDPLTRASKEEYVDNCEAYRLQMSKQVASVALEKIKETLPQVRGRVAIGCASRGGCRLAHCLVRRADAARVAKRSLARIARARQCVTAVQGVAALREIRSFLEAEVESLRRQVQELRVEDAAEILEYFWRPRSASGSGSSAAAPVCRRQRPAAAASAAAVAAAVPAARRAAIVASPPCPAVAARSHAAG